MHRPTHGKHCCHRRCRRPTSRLHRSLLRARRQSLDRARRLNGTLGESLAAETERIGEHRADAFSGDAFLQALFALAPAQTDSNAPHSQALGPTTTRVAESVTPRRQSSGPLAVPIDCDPALWAFFVDTSRWEEQEPNEDERSLLEYYMSSTAFGVVIQDGTGESRLPKSAHHSSALLSRMRVARKGGKRASFDARRALSKRAALVQQGEDGK